MVPRLRRRGGPAHGLLRQGDDRGGVPAIETEPHLRARAEHVTAKAPVPVDVRADTPGIACIAGRKTPAELVSSPVESLLPRACWASSAIGCSARASARLDAGGRPGVSRTGRFRFASWSGRSVSMIHPLAGTASGVEVSGTGSAPWSPFRALNRRSRRLLLTTKTDENAIAAPAIIGLSNPAAASGIAATL